MTPGSCPRFIEKGTRSTAGVALLCVVKKPSSKGGGKIKNK